MIRFFVRLLLPLLVLLFLRALIRIIFAGFREASLPQNRTTAETPAPSGGELRKDPVCGTYVAIAGSLSRTIDGEMVYFCSEECRKKYRVA